MRGPTRLSLYIGMGNIICDVCTPSHSVYARLHIVCILCMYIYIYKYTRVYYDNYYYTNYCCVYVPT